MAEIRLWRTGRPVCMDAMQVWKLFVPMWSVLRAVCGPARGILNRFCVERPPWGRCQLGVGEWT